VDPIWSQARTTTVTGAGLLPQRQHFLFADSSALPARLAEHHLRKVATLRSALSGRLYERHDCRPLQETVLRVPARR